MKQCCNCDNAIYLRAQRAYICIAPGCKETILFRGKNKPRSCPLAGKKEEMKETKVIEFRSAEIKNMDPFGNSLDLTEEEKEVLLRAWEILNKASLHIEEATGKSAVKDDTWEELVKHFSIQTGQCESE